MADAPDLGSGVLDVKVQVLLGAPKKQRITRKGASLLFSTKGLEGETAMNESPVGSQNRGTPCPQARQVLLGAPRKKTV